MGLRRLQRMIDPATLPRLAVATAAAFALMLVTVPLPGGTTVHVSGVGMIAVLFGVWQGFLALSLVFLLQALMFGDGGVTALPVNALAMGLCGSLAAVAVFRILRRLQTTVAIFCAGWFGTVVPAVPCRNTRFYRAAGTIPGAGCGFRRSGAGPEGQGAGVQR